MSSKLTVSGLASVTPSTPCGSTHSSSTIELDVACRNYAAQDSGLFAVSGTSEAPHLLAPGGVGAIRFLMIRSVDRAAMVALLTSATGGVDQAWPFSDVLYLHVPSPGDPILAAKIVGTGTIEYVAAGDTAAGGGGSPVLRGGFVGSFDSTALLTATDASVYIPGATLARVRNIGYYTLDPRGTNPDDGSSFLASSISGLQWVLT